MGPLLEAKPFGLVHARCLRSAITKDAGALQDRQVAGIHLIARKNIGANPEPRIVRNRERAPEVGLELVGALPGFAAVVMRIGVRRNFLTCSKRDGIDETRCEMEGIVRFAAAGLFSVRV